MMISTNITWENDDDDDDDDCRLSLLNNVDFQCRKSAPFRNDKQLIQWAMMMHPATHFEKYTTRWMMTLACKNPQFELARTDALLTSDNLDTTSTTALLNLEAPTCTTTTARNLDTLHKLQRQSNSNGHRTNHSKQPAATDSHTLTHNSPADCNVGKKIHLANTAKSIDHHGNALMLTWNGKTVNTTLLKTDSYTLKHAILRPIATSEKRFIWLTKKNQSTIMATLSC